jgi:DNA-binding transcriptional LysR family regulator
MDLRHLRYFVAVAEELHFGRAAQRLHVSQPPLSRQIRQLEEELHTELFQRTKRRVYLTTAGEAFLMEARRTLDQAQRAARVAEETGRGELGHVAVGFVEAPLHSGLLPTSVREFRARFPGVTLELREVVSRDQPAALRNGVIDVGLAYIPPANTDAFFAIEPLLRDPLAVALPARHPLAGRPRIRMRDLASETLIVFRRELAPGLHDEVLHQLRRAGLVPRALQEVVQMQTVLALVAAGIGFGLVPRSIARVRRSGVCFVLTRDLTVRLDTHLVWREGERSPTVENFLTVAREVARKIARHVPM